MSQPALTVEVAFVANPYGTLTWTDISAYVVGQVSTSRGRNYELGQTQAGTATLELKNTDGRFDPTNAASPYSPYVLPMRPIRIRATYAGTTYDVWRGFVERWPQKWAAGGSFGTVEMTAVDGFKTVLARKYGTRFPDQVLADSPILYARLNGTVTNLGTAGGGFTSGSGWSNGGAAGLLNGSSDTASTITASSANPAVGWTAPTLTVWTVEALILVNSTAATPLRFADFGSRVVLIYDAVNNNYQVQLSNAGGSSTADTGARVARNTVTHLAVTVDNSSGTAVVTVYVNSVATGSGSITAFSASGVFNIGAFPTVNTSERITLDEAAVYPSLLSATQIANHYRLSLTSNYAEFAQETVDQRVGHILDTVGWPVADRVIDTSLTTLQATGSVAGATSLDLLLAAAAANDGNIYINGAGQFVYQDRQHNYPSGYTPAATFGEAGFPYEGDITIDFDDTYVYNDVQITQANSSPTYIAVTSDTTSQSQYGIQSYTATIPAQNTTDVDGLATYLLTNYRAPHARVAQVTLEGRANPSNFPQILGREIGDVVSVTRHPPGAAPPINLVCVVQGVSQSIDPNAWSATFLLSPLPNVWIVGDSTYGVLDVTAVTAY